jgi:hypothetical protein
MNLQHIWANQSNRNGNRSTAGDQIGLQFDRACLSANERLSVISSDDESSTFRWILNRRW